MLGSSKVGSRVFETVNVCISVDQLNCLQSNSLQNLAMHVYADS